MITDTRKILRAVAEEADLPTPSLTMFRHTYATVRLQTTDGGKPVSVWTVARELGHKTIGRIEDTYGHLSTFLRPRWEVVEYRL
jgi:integrase